MKRAERSYLLGIAVCAVIVLWHLLYPAVPALVRTLVRFPSLASATYLEGTFEFEGERQQQRYFVVNAQGRHEFECGPLTARRPCFITPERYSGLPAKVWYSYWYGSVQHQLTVATGARAHPLDQVVYLHGEAAASSRLIRARPTSYFAIVLLSAFMIWLVTKEVWRRQELNRDRKSANIHG